MTTPASTTAAARDRTARRRRLALGCRAGGPT
jgi:hypothetical protein